jgi:hypothetical protein
MVILPRSERGLKLFAKEVLPVLKTWRTQGNRARGRVRERIMAETEDSKGEYRGLAYRNDIDLKAWLARRPGETALEPGLPIIDPHHHFWDTPRRGRYLLPELLAP